MCSTGTLLNTVFLYYSDVRSKNLIGLRVRKRRKELKITQMELAAQLQLLSITIDRSGVAKLESGRRPASDIEVYALAKILKVPIPWLFEEGDIPSKPVDSKRSPHPESS
jgi:transcriptional regulator with XRE-family HTH domain